MECRKSALHRPLKNQTPPAAMAELLTIGVMPATFRFSAIVAALVGHPIMNR